MNNDFTWLTNWFWAHCNGEWEHEFGIKICTTEQGGWHLFIRILETELEWKEFTEQKWLEGKNDWVHCVIKDGAFSGYCSANNLLQLLNIFREWAEPYFNQNFNVIHSSTNDEEIIWLADWYQKCNLKNQKSGKRIDLGTLDNPGWAIDINLKDMKLEQRDFQEIKIDNSTEDWIFCSVINHNFCGNSGPFNSLKMIKIFREWIQENR